MRLYTIENDGKEYVAVETKDGNMITLDTLGVSVRDMNELISRYDEISESIISDCNANGLEKSPCFLKPGDIVRCEIKRIGVLQNVVGKAESDY